MLHQGHALREGLAALIALERPPARVRAVVVDQLGFLAEALPAHPARVGPLASGGPLVPEEGGALGEVLTAQVTHEGLLPGVDALVAHQDEIGRAHV